MRGATATWGYTLHNDTIVQQPQQPVAEDEVPAVLERSEAGQPRVRHPYQVLRQLPADATPAQQDSAIQAVFHVENTHLSTRPDTLSLPGYGKGKNVRDVDLPQYYREGFFTSHPLFHPELNGGRYGVAGDPMPYTIRGDNTITALLIGCFVLMMLSVSRSKRFILRQAKDLVYEPLRADADFSETSGEYRFQFFLVLQACLLMAIIAFLYTQECVASTFTLESQYQLIAVFFALITGYFALKGVLSWGVGNLFFGRLKTARWLKSMLFLVAVEGFLLFPQVMVQSFFDLSAAHAVIFTGFVFLVVKLLALYKLYLVFFKGKAFVLQIFLYFCALEIVPLLMLGGIMVMTVDYLKIKY